MTKQQANDRRTQAQAALDAAEARKADFWARFDRALASRA